jgi:hypothetical protein
MSSPIRDLIRTKGYFGSDRRRNVNSSYNGPERRKRGKACWDLERNRDVSAPRNDLRVVDLRKARVEKTAENSIWSAAGNTDGACTMGWRSGQNPRHTPLGMIAEMAYDGKLPKGAEFVRLLRKSLEKLKAATGRLTVGVPIPIIILLWFFTH